VTARVDPEHKSEDLCQHNQHLKPHSCRNAEPADLDKFADHLAGHYVPNSVIVDATASETPAQKYLDWMRKGIHVITPNKKLNSGPLDLYRELKKFQRDSYIHFLYEVRRRLIGGRAIICILSVFLVAPMTCPCLTSVPPGFLVKELEVELSGGEGTFLQADLLFQLQVRGCRLRLNGTLTAELMI